MSKKKAKPGRQQLKPAQQTAQYVEQPAQPVTQPVEQPQYVEQPTQPVTQPVEQPQYVEQPTQPVAQPVEQPQYVEQPTQPVTQPAQASGKRRFFDKKTVIVAISTAAMAALVTVGVMFAVMNLPKQPPVLPEETSSDTSEPTSDAAEITEPQEETSEAVVSQEQTEAAPETTTEEAVITDETEASLDFGQITDNAPSVTEPQTPQQTAAVSEKPSDNVTETQGYVVAYNANNSWESSGATMYGLELQIKNGTGSAISGWKLELEIDGLVSVDGWNGTYSASGSKLTVTDAGYNGEISAGGVVTLGCNLGVKSSLNIKSARINGKSCTVKAGTVAASNNNNGGNNGGNNNIKTFIN